VGGLHEGAILYVHSSEFFHPQRPANPDRRAD
jgi:hypothetical protein